MRISPKIAVMAAALAAGVAASPAQAQEILGPDAAACRAGADGPAALVRVTGFKDRGGNLRVQLYGNNPAEFLEKGKKLRRVDLPVEANGDMAICVALPRFGEFAIAVRHDRDGNGKSGWSDGGGFSGNPKLSLASVKPSFEDAVFVAKPGVQVVDVILNYRHGLSIRPVTAARP
jgi:uncharacterized protein (DUF2141 family)